jgi:hypothetical protein
MFQLSQFIHGWQRFNPARLVYRAGCVALILFACAGFNSICRGADQAATGRLRLLIETDAGGDPDDEQSLVRFLLYANEWDVEGIIANRARVIKGENYSREPTGLGVVRELIRAYGQCHSNLVQHDVRYPTAETLLARTVAGYNDTDDGVNLILRIIDAPDPRPVWYSDWGTATAATNNLRRALDRVLRERGQSGYAKFKNKLRLSSYDMFAGHTRIGPDWRFWVNTWQPELNRQRWYHRFSAITATAGGFDLRRDVLTGHGPLGALYPTNTTHRQKEGDTACFLYLVPTGMNDPYEPTWGSWAGRYGARRDEFPNLPYFWANVSDQWRGTTNRDNTLRRWAVHLQNDFRARLDWCVKDRAGANHAPSVVLNGVEGTEVLRLRARSGQSVKLDCTGTKDPDGQPLDYEWFIYPEAGTYRGEVVIEQTNSPMATVRVPRDAAGKSIHAVVVVTDRSDPPLTRYRRAVIDLGETSARNTIAPFFNPPPELAKEFGSFRSPLLFHDGSHVASPADWERRRAEILREWHEFMGPWPEIIEKPKIEVTAESRRDNFAQKRIRLEIAPGQEAEGWLLVPDGAKPRPAVLVVYYEPETSVGLNPEQPFRDFALQLARRGFVTLSIGTPGGNAWKPETGAALCQPLSFHAYVAANCWQALASLPEVDRARIGVTGHSYGGKWAMFAGALWDKFAAVAVSDPGIVFDETRSNVNYWEPWYLGLDAVKRPKAGIPSAENPRTGAYRRLIEQGRDLHELHALIAPRPFLVSGGAEDPPARWTALNHTIAVNQLLGFTNRVAMTNRKEHAPDATSNAQLYAFFESFLAAQ